MLSIKLNVHNIYHCCQRMTEPRLQYHIQRILWSLVVWFLYASGQTYSPSHHNTLHSYQTVSKHYQTKKTTASRQSSVLGNLVVVFTHHTRNIWMAICQVSQWSPGCPFIPFLHLFQDRTFKDNWAKLVWVFFTSHLPFLSPIVKALILATENTHWSRLFLFQHRIAAWRDIVLALCLLFNASACQSHNIQMVFYGTFQVRSWTSCLKFADIQSVASLTGLLSLQIFFLNCLGHWLRRTLASFP